MISRLLQHDDFLWALDHSRRRYRVRPTQAGDRPPGPERPYTSLITIVRIGGGEPIVMMDRCGISPGEWFDSDDYAEFRLLAINRKLALREYRGRS